MKSRAVIKKFGQWWIGWLIDLPGVYAQERTREELVESLRQGAEEMLAADTPVVPDAQMIVIDIPDPRWGLPGAKPQSPISQERTPQPPVANAFPMNCDGAARG